MHINSPWGLQWKTCIYDSVLAQSCWQAAFAGWSRSVALFIALAYSKASDGRDWTYMFSGPFADEQQFLEHLNAAETLPDTVCYVVIDLSHARAVGMLALMGIEPAHGVIDVGQVAFSPETKRTPLATEAHFLLMTYAFEQWVVAVVNGSATASMRLLAAWLHYEGMFRQAVIYKGRSRDTCWYAIIDSDWPAIHAGFERCLDPVNFDRQGRQKKAGGASETDEQLNGSCLRFTVL